MNDLLAHPAVQAGVAPFLAAMVIAFVLARTPWLALAQLAALLTVVGLAIGFSFTPWTALRKLVATVLIVGAWAAVLPGTDGASPARGLRIASLVALAAATVWMLWRLLAQQDGAAAWAYGVGSVLFVGVLCDGAIRTGRSALAEASGAVVLAFVSGMLAVLGSSVLLAQLAIAAAAGAGACVLVLLRRPAASLPGIALPAAAASSLGTLLVAWQGTLPWYSLLPMLAVPWAAGAAARPDRPGGWRLAVAAGVRALVPMVLAVGLALASGQRFPTI